MNIQAIIQGIVFVKIAISNCLNEMNTLFRQRLATDLILHHQQSKNIRTNATVLDDMIRITSGESLHSIYMDWWRGGGRTLATWSDYLKIQITS